MKVNRALEQRIALFGESGSGKTVLLSSFYGAAQEPEYQEKSLFRIVADDVGLGGRLHSSYLGMRDAAHAPAATRFTSTSYVFNVKLKEGESVRAAKRRPFDALRLVWHDYPGEWFEQSVFGEEGRRKVEAFQSLLASDVAVLLVDGQRLIDYAGEEERYLKSLFSNFGAGLLGIKDDILVDGKPLVEFPRIWILALSKADLLPETDVYAFRDLLVRKASAEIEQLRKILAEFVQGEEALSVGEDFLLLSSAKFEPGRIEVAERIGIDLVLPIAATLPFERHVRWAEMRGLPAKVAENLIDQAPTLAAALVGMVRLPGPIGPLLKIAAGLIPQDVLQRAANMASDKVRELNAEALQRREFMTAVLTGFRLDLDAGERERVLLPSRR